MTDGKAAMRGIRKTRANILSAIALACGLTLAPVAAASATVITDTPVDLDPGFITDRAGVLTAQQEVGLERRLGDLAATEGLPELYVILVPRFDEPANALAWADRTAQLSNLASDQYLLAIATDGRTLAISAEYGGAGPRPLSESRVLQIEDRLGGDYLRNDDWAGGIEYVADEFSQAPWPWWLWALGIAGLALTIFIVTRIVLFLRHRAALAAELRTLEGQKKRAARQLVHTDEAVRTSEQELGFVTAEFGEETTAEFAAVLDASRSKLEQAFRLLEKLQDAVRDTPQDTRSWTKEIIRLCGEVDRTLDDRTKKLAALRAVTKDSIKTLERLKAARASAEGLEADAEARLATLSAAFPPAQLVGVAGNAREIADRLGEADEELKVLNTAIVTRKPRAISDAVHEVERLLAEATELGNAVSAYAEALAAHSVASAAGSRPTGTTSNFARATAAVRAAEASARARPGGMSAPALSQLYLAQRHLADATTKNDPNDKDALARAALLAAQQVQSDSESRAAGAAPSGTRFATPTRAADDTPIMYDARPSASASSRPRQVHPADDGPSVGGKALSGAICGAALGLFSGLSIAGGEVGAIVVFVVAGIGIGALSGVFSGRGGGGSSSGWGGSSHSSYRSRSSRSSFRSSSSRSSGRSSRSSRSSGRSGGRRF